MDRRERMRYFENFDYPTFINNPKVAAFIGKDYDYFKNLWAKDFEKKNGNAQKVMACFHWTWLGVILGPVVWFSYRKMYKMAWLVIGLFSAITFVEVFFNLNAGSGGYFAANLVLALMAKNMYLMHTIEFFRQNADLPGHQLDDLVAAKGGTSVAAPFVMFIMFFACMIGAAVIGDLAAGNPISFTLATESTTIQSTP